MLPWHNLLDWAVPDCLCQTLDFFLNLSIAKNMSECSMMTNSLKSLLVILIVYFFMMNEKIKNLL
jgi:hypothetical protein